MTAIADAAGVGVATVDRVLNRRAPVRSVTEQKVTGARRFSTRSTVATPTPAASAIAVMVTFDIILLLLAAARQLGYRLPAAYSLPETQPAAAQLRFGFILLPARLRCAPVPGGSVPDRPSPPLRLPRLQLPSWLLPAAYSLPETQPAAAQLRFGFILLPARYSFYQQLSEAGQSHRYAARAGAESWRPPPLHECRASEIQFRCLPIIP
jgi:hypothetical protein